MVDVSSHYKEAEPLATKEAKEVAEALCRIFRQCLLKWPKLLQGDPGREFMGTVSQVLAKHGVSVRLGHVDILLDQGNVERFNRTLGEQLFGHQYAQEMRLTSGQRSTERVARRPGVVAALNSEVTRLTCKKPSNAIKANTVAQKPSVVPGGNVVLRSRNSPRELAVASSTSQANWKEAIDTVWSLEVYRLDHSMTKPDEPALYYLQDGPHHGFVRENFWWSPKTPNCHLMGFSGGDGYSPSSPVTFNAGQPYILKCVTSEIVQAINAILLGVLWLVGP